MFDYLLYRMYMAFEKRDKGTVNSLWLASLGLVVFQFLIFLAIASFVDTFWGYNLLVDFNMDMKYRKLLLVAFFILMSLVYYKHYKKKIGAIIEKYKKRRIIVKDWMLIIIAVMLAFSFVFWDWLYKLIVE